MIKKIISEGNKVELKRLASISQLNRENGTGEVKTYYSLVSEIIDEDRLKITMPLEGGRVVPLPVNGRYSASFYTENGLYQARLIIVDRYKEDNIYMLVVELTSDLVKFQRRQYYRLGCTLDIKYKKIEDEEQEFYEDQTSEEYENLEDCMEGTAVDISGGGMRFVSNELLESDSNIYVVVDIQYDNVCKRYGLNAKVIKSTPLERRSDKFEHRVEYCNIDGKVRESLIRYIFDEERRQRKKESDNK